MGATFCSQFFSYWGGRLIEISTKGGIGAAAASYEESASKLLVCRWDQNCSDFLGRVSGAENWTLRIQGTSEGAKSVFLCRSESLSDLRRDVATTAACDVVVNVGDFLALEHNRISISICDGALLSVLIVFITSLRFKGFRPLPSTTSVLRFSAPRLVRFDFHSIATGYYNK